MRSNGEGKPVVALDIDGTLGDYHANFLRFASLYFNRADFSDLIGKPNPGLPLWEHLGLSRREYRDGKLAYRQGGWKRWMPAYPGVATLTNKLREEEGAEVWLCTTRPYLRLDNVDPDTRWWLDRVGIQYDALLFDPAHEEDGSKYHELARQAGGRVASVVDDLPEMMEAATMAGVPELNPFILRDQPYNQHLDYQRRAHSSKEIFHLVQEDLLNWRANND